MGASAQGARRVRVLGVRGEKPNESFWYRYAYSGHSTCQVARHERAFGPLKAGGRRVEWYRYGDSNPGPVAENHVS